MLNIAVEGDSYVLNITLPNNSFNDALLKKIVGPTFKVKTEMRSIYRTNNLSDLHKKIDKLLTLFKILDYGTL